MLLTREDVDAKADALIEFIRDRVVGREWEDGTMRAHRVRIFQELEAWFEDVLAFFQGCLKKRVARDVVPAGGADATPRPIELPEDPYA